MGMTKQVREALKARITKLLSKEPWLTNYTIAERFNCKAEFVGDIRTSMGMRAPITETLTKNDIKNSRMSEALPKLRTNPHYIDFGDRK